MAIFTVATNSGSASTNSRGQSFKPNVAGPDGTGSPGNATTVFLNVVRIGYPTSSTTGRCTTAFIYESIPTLAQLANGTNSLYVATSYSDQQDTFGTGTYSRDFTFDRAQLDPTKTYYILFASNQYVRYKLSTNPYSDGAMYNTSLQILATSDLQFCVEMEDS